MTKSHTSVSYINLLIRANIYLRCSNIRYHIRRGGPQIISRQGVYDIITRAEKTLIETENKTGLIKRFLEIQGNIFKVEALIKRLDCAEAGKIDKILHTLRKIKEMV